MNDSEMKSLMFAALSGIAPKVNLDAPPGKARLRDEHDLDPLACLNFISGSHERTRSDIPEANYPKLFTLDGAIAYLRR